MQARSDRFHSSFLQGFSTHYSLYHSHCLRQRWDRGAIKSDERLRWEEEQSWRATDLALKLKRWCCQLCQLCQLLIGSQMMIDIGTVLFNFWITWVLFPTDKSIFVLQSFPLEQFDHRHLMTTWHPALNCLFSSCLSPHYWVIAL